MREFRFRFRLENKLTKEIIFVYTALYNPMNSNDLLKYPIDLNEYDILDINEYIGRTDKFGKKIYEGDIVEFSFKKKYFIGKIFWNEETNGYDVTNKADNKELWTNISVIGNIHNDLYLLD